MIRRLLLRLLRDLALIPLTAFLVYQGVAMLPLQKDTDSKTSALASIQRQMENDLGVHEHFGFIRPWQKLWNGERLGDSSRAYTAKDLARALAGSLRIGALGLVLALLIGGGYATARVASSRTPADSVLELVPTLVYGTPTFILAVIVALRTGTAMLGDQVSYEPIAAAVVAVAPGIFMGTILLDALRAEMDKPYVRTALAKGATPRRALLAHALPNALPALLDALPPVATALLAGSFVVEKLFHVTYFGMLYVDSAQEKQLAVVVVATTIFATLLLLVSMATEVLRFFVDPRARAEALEVEG